MKKQMLMILGLSVMGVISAGLTQKEARQLVNNCMHAQAAMSVNDELKDELIQELVNGDYKTAKDATGGVVYYFQKNGIELDQQACLAKAKRIDAAR